MLISTNVFAKAIFTVTGKDMAVFIDQWVHTGGHAKFHLSFVFNRKRYVSHKITLTKKYYICCLTASGLMPNGDDTFYILFNKCKLLVLIHVRTYNYRHSCSLCIK